MKLRLGWPVTLGGVALILLAMTVHLDIRNHRVFWFKLFDASHFPLLGAFTALLRWGTPVRRLPSSSGCLSAAGLAAISALLVEVAQPLAGRTASSTDLVNGLCGIGATATGIYLWERGHGRVWRAAHLLGSLLLFTLLLMPAVTEARAIVWRARSFPQLARFEDPIELRLWRPVSGTAGPTRIGLDVDAVSEGRRALRVDTAGGDWPGVRYTAGLRDWSDFADWRARVFNPGEPFPLNVRIDDDGDCSNYEGRFNGSSLLQTGWNDVAFSLAEIERGPRDRLLDVGSIRWVYLFTGRDDPGRTFVVDDVRLE